MLVTGKVLAETVDRRGVPHVADDVSELVVCTRGTPRKLENQSMRQTKAAFRDRFLAIVRNNPVPCVLFIATTLAAIGIAVWG